MSSRILRYAKVAEEAEFREDPIPSAQATMDIASASLDAPSETQQIWEGGIGRGPRFHRPGFYSPSGNLVIAVDVHTVGWFLRWALGGYVFTSDGGSGDHDLHEFYGVKDTVLPSFAAWLGKDVFEHVFRGCMASQVALEVSDGYAQLTVDVIAAKDEKGTLDEDVLDDLPLPPPMTFPDLQMFVGGTGSEDEVSAAVRSLTVTVNNNGDAANARGLGSRFPQREIPAGQRETTVEFTNWYEDEEHVERLWGSSDGPSDDGSTELEVRVVGDSGDDGSLQIDWPRMVFTQVQTQPSGRDQLEQQVTATALLDTVTLEDSSTVETEIYARLENERGEYAAA